MAYRNYPGSSFLLIGYDPERDLPLDHVARLVEQVVEENVSVSLSSGRPGQPAYHPKLLLKVLIYGYATGLRSSRQLEKHCTESLAYLYLTRGDAPTYRTLCTARTSYDADLKQCWIALFAVAEQLKIKRIGRIDVDSTKIRADVSPESVLKRSEFGFFLEMLKEIVVQAELQDKTEDVEGYSGQTQTGAAVNADQMREVIRGVRHALHAQQKGDPSAKPAPVDLGPRMLPRVKEAVSAIEEAMTGERKHLSLTDPDAQMMGEGRTKRIQECHALEVATDNGLLVCAQSSQSPTDNGQLMGLVDGAKEQEPDGVSEVAADSGYFGGDNIVALENAEIKTCIPNVQTATELHRGLPVGSLGAKPPECAMTYDESRNCYQCGQGKLLLFVQTRKKDGQTVSTYSAESDCTDCPVKALCMTSKTGKRRMLQVGIHHQQIRQVLDRFKDPEHQQRYYERANNVETVFGFLRTVLNFNRWLLRGKDKIASEAALLRIGYQIRKVHSAKWSAAKATPA